MTNLCKYDLIILLKITIIYMPRDGYDGVPCRTSQDCKIQRARDAQPPIVVESIENQRDRIRREIARRQGRNT